MATTTLTLYKHTKLDDMKNFIVDDLASYLSTKESETITDLQYQRFELNKTIKLNKSQSYLLKGQSLNRYDYCKFSIGNVDYFYFIIRSSWKAEETIELELKMDTLNTFAFSSNESDATYTLSNKTLVKREHKDRFALKDEEVIEYEERDATQEEQNYIDDWKNQIWFKGGVNIKFDSNALYRSLLESEPLLTYPLQLFPNSQTIILAVVGDDIQSIIVNKIWFESRYMRVFTGDGNYQDFRYDSPYTFIFQIGSIPLTGTPTSFDKAATWSYISPFFISNKVYDPIINRYYERLVDQYQEGLSTILFKNNEEKLIDADGQNQWYVVYASTNAVVTSDTDTQSKYVNPVAVRFYSDLGYEITTSSDKVVTLYASDVPNYTDNAEYILLNRETLGDGYFEYNGVQYRTSNLISPVSVGFAIRRDSKNMFTSLQEYSWKDIPTVRQPTANRDMTPVSSINFYGINRVPLYKTPAGIALTPYEPDRYININSGNNEITGASTKWEDLDLTNPLLIKAFAFPYSPCDFLVGKTKFSTFPDNVSYSSNGKAFELLKPQQEPFKRLIQFESQSPFNAMFVKNIQALQKQARDINMESKLFHSDFYQVKFVYDSFAFSFNFEDLDTSKLAIKESFAAEYVVSKNVVSKFAFIFNQYVCKREVQNYNNVLTIERNNEKALFNNAYLNYIRSGGFSYDTKKASSQNAINGITTALSFAGSFASFMGGSLTQNPLLFASGVTLAVGTASSIVNNIHVAQEQDRAIAQKMNQNYIQGTSVQGSEDIDILTAFSGNKAKLCYYELSDVMKNAMWDLFYYCGYATHEQKIPNVSTRLYFNYVQADIVYDEYSFNDDIADDIKNKWKEGVTFFHKVNNEWDIEQQYENYEVSLI